MSRKGMWRNIAAVMLIWYYNIDTHDARLRYAHSSERAGGSFADSTGHNDGRVERRDISAVLINVFPLHRLTDASAIGKCVYEIEDVRVEMDDIACERTNEFIVTRERTSIDSVAKREGRSYPDPKMFKADLLTNMKQIYGVIGSEAWTFDVISWRPVDGSNGDVTALLRIPRPSLTPVWSCVTLRPPTSAISIDVTGVSASLITLSGPLFN